MALTIGDRLFDTFTKLTNAKDPYKVATDLRNLASPNLVTASRGALGTAGTVVNAPELGVSEVYAQGITPTGPTYTPRPSTVDDGSGSSSGSTSSTSSTGGSSGSTSSTGSSSGSTGSSGGSSSRGSSGPSEAEIAARRAAEEAAAREAAARAAYANRYNAAVGNISAEQEKIPGRLQEGQQFLQNKFGQFQEGLQGARQAAYDKLGNARSGVAEKRASSIADLGQNLNSMMRASNLQLGAMGAGDSSASEVMAPYAFSKLGTQGMADVNRQANQQFLEIDSQEVEVANTYQQELGGLQIWLGDQEQSLREYYNDIADRLEAEKRGADDAKMAAIQSMEEGLLNQANQRLQTLQDEARAYAQNLDTWARERLAQLNNAKLQMQNNANFDPRAIVQSEIPGLQMGQVSSGGVGSAIGGIRRREDENYY